MGSTETVPDFFHQPAGDAAGGLEFSPFRVHGFQQSLPFLAYEGDIRKVNGNASVSGFGRNATPGARQLIHPWTHEPALNS